MPLPLTAIFGPTATGKTAVAIELGHLLAERGERTAVVGCDSIQIYAGLEVLSGAPDSRQRQQIEHHLTGFVPVTEEFSAGRYAALARETIDRLLTDGIRPVVVGGTGLYLQAALTNLELRPPLPAEVRQAVEAEMDRVGPEALHARLPERFREWVAPGDRKRITRIHGLLRIGEEPAPDSEGGGNLWTRNLRHPTVLIGLSLEREVLAETISARVDAMAAAGAGAEAAAAEAAGASRTARAALGFREFQSGDLERIKTLHRRYGRRQITWMRNLPEVTVIDRTGLDDRQVAERILARLDGAAATRPEPPGHG